ncbi:ABC transporter ATP-binding protein [Stappia sp. F7233]|uniref:ABC transporter ATP-binding protein n=1 Tax=Stappia albiluteola TaxID=2758565 RepID=A0A839ABP0_9HYPH|nr:ABC transporter ATP-binding protein [Stappia albiluteola]MBA5776317.1 ABC transporter ATP-binding protein [Stappia albiluteola]
MIHLDRVSKSFKHKGHRKYIVENVSFSIPRGRSLGLLGRNGAGKSTLLRMIAGIAYPDSGKVIRQARVSWPLGFAGSLHGALTGEQNVRFIARIYNQPTEALVAYVEEFAELGRAFRMPVSTYSSGMRARLAFGVSMSVKFDYYLIDEITAVGDTNFKNKCKDVFHNKLADSDIIMVSHSVKTIREYCQAGVVLENGKLTYFENIEEAIAVHENNMKS